MKARTKRTQILLNRKIIFNNRNKISELKQSGARDEIREERELNRIDLESARLIETLGVNAKRPSGIIFNVDEDIFIR